MSKDSKGPLNGPEEASPNQGGTPLAVSQRQSRFMMSLKELGLHIASDEKLSKRLEGFVEFSRCVSKATNQIPDDPLEALEDLEADVHEINNRLHVLSIPFGRAMDNKNYATMMQAWSTLYTVMLEAIVTSKCMLIDAFDKGSMRATDPQVRETIESLKTFYIDVYIKAAMLIAEVTWSAIDVAPSYAAVVYQPPIPVSGRLPTTMQVPRNFNSTMDEV